MNTLRILWISGSVVVLEDLEGARFDIPLTTLASDEKMIARLAPADAFRLGYEVALRKGNSA